MDVAAYCHVGGYPKFVSQGFNSAYLPLWLQAAGYGTYYVGKLINAQTIVNYDSPHAAGWTGSDFLLDPYTYRYLNSTFQRNHDKPISYEGRYSTDVLADKAYAFLDDAVAAEKPFFLGIAPTSPHSDVNIKETLIDGNFSEHSVVQSPPIPAERHKHLFSDVIVPRTPHFNPDTPSGVSWISRLPQQNSTNIAFNDDFYRNRLRSLQAVDEIVDGVISRLKKRDLLENTYIFYTTDNGYHIGQHRLQPGKQCAFEEDINIPMIVRGPGISKNVMSDAVTSHTDLAPTFLSLAGGEIRSDFDGVAMPLFPSSSSTSSTTDLSKPLLHTLSRHKQRQEHITIESWGIIMSEGHYGSHLYLNHTYKALRLIGSDYNLLYTVWCNNEHELYDLNTDSYELENLYTKNHSSEFLFTRPEAGQEVEEAGKGLNGGKEGKYDFPNMIYEDGDEPKLTTTSKTTLSRLLSRLDALVMVLKTCKGQSCVYPWDELHPSGGGGTEAEAEG